MTAEQNLARVIYAAVNDCDLVENADHIDAAFAGERFCDGPVLSAGNALVAARAVLAFPSTTGETVPGDEPVAYLHTMHMEGGQTYDRLTAWNGVDEDEPSRTAFGFPGRDYSEEYRVTTTPLYASPKQAPVYQGEVERLREVARMVVEASDLAGFSGPLGDAARAALSPSSPRRGRRTVTAGAGRVPADQALVAARPEPVPVSAHAGDGPSRDAALRREAVAVINEMSRFMPNATEDWRARLTEALL